MLIIAIVKKYNYGLNVQLYNKFTALSIEWTSWTCDDSALNYSDGFPLITYTIDSDKFFFISFSFTSSFNKFFDDPSMTRPRGTESESDVVVGWDGKQSFVNLEGRGEI